jgi:hypothetical protein
MKTSRRKPNRDPWEHALTCPLPSQTSYQLLQALRQDILAYLEWVTGDLVQDGNPAETEREIQRAADRLKQIAAMMPAAKDVAAREEAENAKIDLKELRRSAGQRMAQAAQRQAGSRGRGQTARGKSK